MSCFFPYGWTKKISSVFLRLNGSLPNNIEIKNNTLYFKGPVTYELGGTYVCDATNSIGTRSGLVEVNVTGKLWMLIRVSVCVCMCWGWESFNQGPGDCSSGNVSFVRVKHFMKALQHVNMCQWKENPLFYKIIFNLVEHSSSNTQIRWPQKVFEHLSQGFLNRYMQRTPDDHLERDPIPFIFLKYKVSYMFWCIKEPIHYNVNIYLYFYV